MWDTIGVYGLSVAVADLDNDGWPDIYLANDSTAATLYQNQKNGTFKDTAIEAGAALSPDGRPQAGMGVSIGDYNRDGTLDIVKTNFAAIQTLCTPVLEMEPSRTVPTWLDLESIRTFWVGELVFSTWITMAGSIS